MTLGRHEKRMWEIQFFLSLCAGFAAMVFTAAVIVALSWSQFLLVLAPFTGALLACMLVGFLDSSEERDFRQSRV